MPWRIVLPYIDLDKYSDLTFSPEIWNLRVRLELGLVKDFKWIYADLLFDFSFTLFTPQYGV